MSSETEYTFWQAFLATGKMQKSKVPKKVLGSSIWKNLYSELPNAAILTTDRISNGSSYIINEHKRDIVVKSVKALYPNHNGNVVTKIDSVAAYRSSKKGNTTEKSIFFLRGFEEIEIDSKIFMLKEATQNYGVAAFVQPNIKCNKICWVENKDSFLIAERLLGNDYVYMHKYGRLGERDFESVTARELIVFPDYDYIGLNEYLTIKQIHPNASLYIPSNFDYLCTTYSKPLPVGQIASERVKQSNEPIVSKIRESIQKTTHFLEQQALFINESRT